MASDELLEQFDNTRAYRQAVVRLGVEAAERQVRGGPRIEDDPAFRIGTKISNLMAREFDSAVLTDALQ